MYFFSRYLTPVLACFAASCSIDPTGGAPREVILPLPLDNPTEIRFEIENLPLSAFAELTPFEKSFPPQERVKIELKKYAERIARERGWCANGVKLPKSVSANIGAGRYITRFTVECELRAPK